MTSRINQPNDDISSVDSLASGKQLLMLPGPEWPRLDFCYRSNTNKDDDNDGNSNTESYFTIVGRPIFTHTSTMTKKANVLNAESIPATDHAIKTASSVWDASLILAKFLEKNANELELKNKRTIELGAGQGIPSMAAAILGASATVTDAPEAVTALQEVIRLHTSLDHHNKDHSIRVCALDWNECPAWTVNEQWDIIMASDVLWLYQLIEPFVLTLKTLSDASPHARIFISHQTRANRVDKQFSNLLQASQLQLKEVPSSQLDMQFWKDTVHIWEITRQ
ncbi:putative methyltransferase-domain-containing protein [Syncephalis fuscata]|nr:putative methyltransferase-domain-containing protein [Syncephalis fuscata]